MNGVKTYKAGEKVYDIPEPFQEDFLLTAPDAIEVESFTVGKDTFDIPVGRVEEFLKVAPKAKRLKKKEFQQLSASYGEQATALLPAKSIFESSAEDYLQPIPAKKDETIIHKPVSKPTINVDEIVKNLPESDDDTVRDILQENALSQDIKDRAEKIQKSFDLTLSKTEFGKYAQTHYGDEQKLIDRSLLGITSVFDYVTPVKTADKSLNAYLGGSVHSIYDHFGQTFRTWDRIAQMTDEALGYAIQAPLEKLRDIIFSEEYLERLAKKREKSLKEVEKKAEIIGRPKTPLIKLAEWYEGEAKQFKEMPNDFKGMLLDNIMGYVPFFMELTLTPELKLASGVGIMTKGIGIKNITTAPPLVTLTATKGLFRGIDESEAETLAGITLDGFKQMGLSAADGLFMHTLGVKSGQLGSLIKNKTLGVSVSSLANGIGFGGYGALSEWSQTGQIDPTRVMAEAAFGAVLGIPSIGRMVGIKSRQEKVINDARRKAIKNFFSSTPETISKIHKMEIDPVKLRKESNRLGVEASKTKDINTRGEILAAKTYIDNLIDINAVKEDVLRRPDYYKDLIDREKNLDQDGRKAFNDFMDRVVQDNLLPEVVEKPAEAKKVKETAKKIELSPMETELIQKGYTAERAREMKDMFDVMTKEYNIEPVEYAKKQKELKEKPPEKKKTEAEILKEAKEEIDLVRQKEGKMPEREKVYDTYEEFKEDFLSDPGNLYNADVRLSNKERQAARKNLLEGKKTKQAELLESAIKEFYEQGYIVAVTGSGNETMRHQVSFESILKKEEPKHAGETYELRPTGKGEKPKEGIKESKPIRSVRQEYGAEAAPKEEEIGVSFKGKKYTNEEQVKEALNKGDISGSEYSQVSDALTRKNFKDSKEKLRTTLDKFFTKQAVGEESARLPEVYNALVDFIKQAIKMYGAKIKSARDIAKYTGVKYNQVLKDAYKEATTGRSIGEGKMRGFPKRIKEFKEFKDIKLDIEQTPELRYKPQSLKEAKKKLETMSEAEVVEASEDVSNFIRADKNDNTGVLATIELINRYREQGKDVMPLIEMASKAGTTMGQLIRQFGELKSSTPEGIVLTVDKSLDLKGRKLTKESKDKLKSLSKDYLDAKQRLKNQAEKTQKVFTDKNLEEYNKLKKETEQAYVKFAQYTQRLTPKDFWDIMGMTLQGNLLTPMSQITNVYANLMNVPITSGASVIASPLDVVHSMVTGKPRVTTLHPRVLWEGLKGLGFGTKEAMGQLLTGVPTQEKADLKMGFQPLRAFTQAFSGKDMPVNAKGKIPVKDRVNKFIEGTVGIPAEVMFRFLNLGDKPFWRMAERTALYRMAKDQGLKGKEMKKFMMFPDMKSAKEAEIAAREATFQENSTTAKLATEFTGGLYKSLKEIPVVGGGLGFLMKTQMPYVKTPSNIISQTLDLAVPPISLSKGVYYAYKGDKRQSLTHIGKAGVGICLYMAAQELLENNLITGSPDEEKKIRNLQYENIPPNSINITGTKRLINGGNPSWRPNDSVVNFTKMGLPGMVLGIHANVYERKKKLAIKQKERLGISPEQKRLSEEALNIIASIVEIPAYSLEQSFLKGTSSLITALSEGKFDYWLTNTFNAISSIPLPNTLGAVNRVTREYIPEVKGNTLEERLGNVIRSKTFQTEDLPLKINLWGEPIKQTPEGAHAWLYQLFDVTKHRQLIAKPESKFVYELYLKTEDSDVAPSVPGRTLTIRNKPYYMTDREYMNYCKMIGKARFKRFSKDLQSGKFDSYTDEQKIRHLKRIWDNEYDRGKREFIKSIGK